MRRSMPNKAVKNDMMSYIPMKYRVCAYCGDVFTAQAGYAYKYKTGEKAYYFCGWNCMCQARRTGKPSRGKEPVPVGRWNSPIEVE